MTEEGARGPPRNRSRTPDLAKQEVAGFVAFGGSPPQATLTEAGMCGPLLQDDRPSRLTQGATALGRQVLGVASVQARVGAMLVVAVTRFAAEAGPHRSHR